jgi:hypothetical protein
MAKTKMETLDILKRYCFLFMSTHIFKLLFLEKLFIRRKVIRPSYACRSSLLQTVRTGWVTYGIIRDSFGFVCLIFVYKFRHVFEKHLIQINGLEAELQLRDEPYPSLYIFALKEMKSDFNFKWRRVRGHETQNRISHITSPSIIPSAFPSFPFFYFIFISWTCHDLLSTFPSV